MPEGKNLEVEYSKKFLRSLSKLPREIKDKTAEREVIFKSDPYDSRLKTHKLHGKDAGAFGFWINYSYRVKFTFISLNEVIFLDIGTHDIYS